MSRVSKKNSDIRDVQNAAKTLYANIRFMSPDNPVKTIMITSSVPNEGKSFTSIELAKAIATSGKTVLLVEADMRKRTLAGTIGVHAPHGIYDVLTEEVTLRDAVVPTKTRNLYFLDCEPNIPNPADIISSKRYARLVAIMKKSFDYVIFDTPPVGTFIDAAILSTLVDGTVFTLRDASTKRADVLHAYDQLKRAGARILGICSTFCENTSSDYYYAYYNKQGERVDRFETQEEQLPMPVDLPARRSATHVRPASGSFPLGGGKESNY